MTFLNAQFGMHILSDISSSIFSPLSDKIGDMAVLEVYGSPFIEGLGEMCGHVI
jgi:hypothetical protein